MYNTELLTNVVLFKEIDVDALAPLLTCLAAREVYFEKDDYILSAGDPVTQVGVFLYGNGHIVRDDIDGDRVVVSSISGGEVFGEALCCLGTKSSPVSVIAQNDCLVLFIDFAKILHPCHTVCEYHQQLIANMLFLLAQKNVVLQNRLDVLSKKSTRQKLLTYLQSFGTKNITLPFNREELANFLGVDRSALSYQMSLMKDEGIIDYYKNDFKLK